MNHVPPPHIGAVRIVGALNELSSFPVQDASPIRVVRLPTLPVTLHHLLRAAWAPLHTSESSDEAVTLPQMLSYIAASMGAC